MVDILFVFRIKWKLETTGMWEKIGLGVCVYKQALVQNKERHKAICCLLRPFLMEPESGVSTSRNPSQVRVSLCELNWTSLFLFLFSDCLCWIWIWISVFISSCTCLFYYLISFEVFHILMQWFGLNFACLNVFWLLSVSVMGEIHVCMRQILTKPIISSLCFGSVVVFPLFLSKTLSLTSVLN